MIAVIDYGMGNVRSVCNALEFIGQEPVVTHNPAKIADADRLILPGVGAFGDAMANLKKCGLVEVLEREVLKRRKPLLGICLGLQLLAKSSTEHGFHRGLGWINAEIIRFQIPAGNGFKIPHMGWNEIEPQFDHPMLRHFKREHLTFYFVHSYHIVCHSPADVAATCEYGYEFTAAIHRDNIFATQFHPEKSQDNGLQLLENFVAWQP